jgi:hypothetical protein
LPIVKALIKLPPNDFYYAMFRAWYLICHMTDVMPRRPDWAQLRESALSIFGVYKGVDPNWHSPPRPEWMPTVDVAGDPEPRHREDEPLVRLTRKGTPTPDVVVAELPGGAE